MWAFSLLFSLSGPGALAAPCTLKECFELALQKTETPQIQSQLVTQAEERLSQAKGGVLPSVALQASYQRLDPVPRQRDELHSLRATLTQPVFRGFREFAAVRVAESTVRGSEASLRQSRISIYSGVGQAFYSVLAAERDLRNLRSLLDLSERRVLNLRARSRIGRSRKGDLYSAEAQVAAAQAQVQVAEGAVKQARSQFAFVTGLEPAQELRDEAELPKPLGLAAYLEQVSSRPDLQALAEQLTAAEESVSVARGAHLPSVDLQGNYYFNRTGSLQDSKWDIGLNATLPLYQGGVLQSQVREAAAQREVSSLSLEQARRNARKEVQTAYDALASSLEQFRSLERSAEMSERNYREQNRDYGLGLATGLEVIQALNAYVDSQRARDRSGYQARNAWVALQAAVGVSP